MKRPRSTHDPGPVTITNGLDLVGGGSGRHGVSRTEVLHSVIASGRQGETCIKVDSARRAIGRTWRVGDRLEGRRQARSGGAELEWRELNWRGDSRTGVGMEQREREGAEGRSGAGRDWSVE